MKPIESYITKINALEVGEFYYDSSPQLDMEWGVGHLFTKLNYETLLIVAVEEFGNEEEIRFNFAKTKEGKIKLAQLWSEADLVQLRLWLLSLEKDNVEEYKAFEELKDLLKTSFQELKIHQFYKIKETVDNLNLTTGIYQAGKDLEEIIVYQWIDINELMIKKKVN